MALLTVKPTRIDTAIADEIAHNTNSGLEHLAQAMTWGADEHLLVALAAAGWVVSLVTAVLPHVLKSAFDQTRPDRLTVSGHWHGVPYSGRPCDSFPSGHAVHMGALASAAGLVPAPWRRFARSFALALSLTRVALLAHWASDVMAGFALGAAVERLLRPFTLAKSRERKTVRP